ncbi:hypothetical protein [Aquimarina algiphila]|uniref:hypothetical protein n=1 Tax=Aquimarina algiphila TaxID=2047982 RepID=UPI0024902781|nr:hypothetical protein [Aquimarina algiphila]
MTTQMYKPMELAIYIFGFLSGNLFEDFILKIVMTTVAMVVGTTVSYYWKRYIRKIAWKDIFNLKMRFKNFTNKKQKG